MGHFSVAPGSEVAGIRNGFQIYGFIHTQLPQGGGQANFFDKVCQCLYTGASQFLFGFILGGNPPYVDGKFLEFGEAVLIDVPVVNGM